MFCDLGEFEAEMNKAVARLVLRTEEYVLALQTSMKKISRIYERYHPKIQKLGKNKIN